MEADTWRWIWLAAAAGFVTGEIITTGFFLLPFGVGAGVACILAFLDVGVEVQWIAFVGTSAVGFFSLRPLAKRLDAATPTEGVGSRRLIGEIATALEDIAAGPDGTGRVRVQREEWWAVSEGGEAVAGGATVRITDVRGTRVVVTPVESSQGSDA